MDSLLQPKDIDKNSYTSTLTRVVNRDFIGRACSPQPLAVIRGALLIPDFSDSVLPMLSE